RSEIYLHGTNAFLRFEEDAAINDASANRVWKFNRFNLTSNNVATLGDVTNILNSSLEPGLLGDGSDANLVFDGTSTVAGIVPASSTYTLNRSLFASNLTINSGVVISNLGYRIFVLKNLTNNGAITAVGKMGQNGVASGGSGGGGSAMTANELGGSTLGGGGGAGTGMGGAAGAQGTAGNVVMGGVGGAGGRGGAGGGGRTACQTGAGGGGRRGRRWRRGYLPRRQLARARDHHHRRWWRWPWRNRQWRRRKRHQRCARRHRHHPQIQRQSQAMG